MGLATYGIDFMLSAGNGTIRRVLTEETDIVACWPLHEMAGDQARNIVEDRTHGTYNGTNYTRGVTIDIPEGDIGTTFGSGCYVEVPDDSALGLTQNLSLSGGGYNVRGFIITSTNDATLRAIAQKQVTDSAGNGWHVALKDGCIRSKLIVSGSTIFDFASASIADGALHFFDCIYDPDGTAEAHIYIDGVDSAAHATAVSTQPLPTAANLRIGAFNDGSGTHTATTLSYIAPSRAGSTSVSPIVQAMRSWTDKTTNVRLDAGIRLDYGINGTAPTDRVAETGVLQFNLDNRGSGGGAYAPFHPNVISGFNIGIPVRARITYSTYSKIFRGRLKSAKPTAGANRSNDVACTAVDYMNVLGETRVNLPVLSDTASRTALGRVIDQADKPPAAISLSSADVILPWLFDNARSETMMGLTELQRIGQTDFSMTTVKCQSPGGSLTIDDRVTIQSKAVSATFDNSMNEFEFSYDIEELINRVRSTVHPRSTPAGTVVLYSAGSQFDVEQRESVTIEGVYLDPDFPKRRVGAISIDGPDPGTDYTAISQHDATTDLTASMIVTATTSGNLITITIYNNSGTDAIVNFLQVRGSIASADDPDTIVESDDLSVKQYGPRQFDLDMPYEDDLNVARDAADYILAARSGPIPAARMKFIADRSATLMQQALEREPTDVISVRETMTSGSTYHNYMIMHVSLETDADGFLSCEWLLAPVHQDERFWTLGTSALGTDTGLAWGLS